VFFTEKHWENRGKFPEKLDGRQKIVVGGRARPKYRTSFYTGGGVIGNKVFPENNVFFVLKIVSILCYNFFVKKQTLHHIVSQKINIFLDYITPVHLSAASSKGVIGIWAVGNSSFLVSSTWDIWAWGEGTQRELKLTFPNMTSIYSVRNRG